MSFILDALRKSESERQQDTRPSIARIPDAVPPRRLPAWALGTMAVLSLGVVGLGVAWWQTARPPSSAAAPALDAPGSTPLPLPPRGDASSPAPTRPAASGEAGAERPLRLARSTLREAAEADLAGDRSTAQAAAGPRAARAPDAAAALPAIDAELPRYVAEAGLPALRLELHAYDQSPSGRFVFINGSKYVEGERLSEGPQLIAITADGAVLLANGRQMLLRQE
ncbi:MAG: general secretion pathway protein GspB [Gammaproteobacteria bacterium]|nr:general secretion pathway protein GspB [Gammaproteobacteria bacterium]